MTDPCSVKFTKVAWYLRNRLDFKGKFLVHFWQPPPSLWKIAGRNVWCQKRNKFDKVIERWFTKCCSTVQSLHIMPCLTFHTDEWLTNCDRSGLQFPGMKCNVKHATDVEADGSQDLSAKNIICLSVSSKVFIPSLHFLFVHVVPAPWIFGSFDLRHPFSTPGQSGDPT